MVRGPYQTPLLCCATCACQAVPPVAPASLINMPLLVVWLSVSPAHSQPLRNSGVVSLLVAIWNVGATSLIVAGTGTGGAVGEL